MPSMKRSPGTTNAAHWVSYYVACSTSWIMPPRSPVMDMGLCNWSEIRISYLEFGVDRHFHTHITFIFNGAVHQRDISLSRTLGELWEDITDNNGSYFNCQIRRGEYREWGTDGIGMVHYSDTAKRIKLINALSYLTKLDTQILAVLPAGRRTFGRMETPSRQPRLGRPRLVLCRFD